MPIEKLRLAAGYVKTATDLKSDFGQKLLRSAATGICVGSITLNEKDGNPEPHYGYDAETGTSYNSVGLKNPGWAKFFPNELGKIMNIMTVANKELILSLAPMNAGDLHAMVSSLSLMPYRSWPCRLQINGGCPNVSGHGIIAHDPRAIRALFEEIKDFTDYFEIEFKTAPELGSSVLRQTVDLCAGYGIGRILSANTVKVNTPDDQKGKPYTGSPTCGMAGRPLLALNVKQLCAFRESIGEKKAPVKLIAGGGISAGEHLDICVSAGVVEEAELMTVALEMGPRIFGDIYQEYGDSI